MGINVSEWQMVSCYKFAFYCVYVYIYNFIVFSTVVTAIRLELHVGLE